MRQEAVIMGMPVSIELADPYAKESDIEKAFDYLRTVDQQFSPYKQLSELTKYNQHQLTTQQYSPQLKEILALANQTKAETNGYFDCGPEGECDPSGIVKGWAIYQAAEQLANKGYQNFYVGAGGDIEARGLNENGHSWQVGIRNPFEPSTVIKKLRVSNKGVATSGTYERGTHIYNPHTKQVADEVVSLTVIGPTIYEADRFATAAFAMGKQGIIFINGLDGYDGYMVTPDAMATMTDGFEQYIKR